MAQSVYKSTAKTVRHKYIHKHTHCIFKTFLIRYWHTCKTSPCASHYCFCCSHVLIVLRHHICPVLPAIPAQLALNQPTTPHPDIHIFIFSFSCLYKTYRVSVSICGYVCVCASDNYYYICTRTYCVAAVKYNFAGVCVCACRRVGWWRSLVRLSNNHIE